MRQRREGEKNRRTEKNDEKTRTTCLRIFWCCGSLARHEAQGGSIGKGRGGGVGKYQMRRPEILVLAATSASRSSAAEMSPSPEASTLLKMASSSGGEGV